MKTNVLRLDNLLNQIHTLRDQRKRPNIGAMFDTLLAEIRRLSEERKSKSNQYGEKFQILVSHLNALKGHVFSRRIRETEMVIKKNKHKLRLSSFELMEHNFWENSHTNVLRYLFDYKFLGDHAVEILFRFINGLTDISIPDLRQKLAAKSYIVEREFNIGNGRIDILITDPKHRFCVVIENKIFSKIVYDKSANEDDLNSQLDRYREYVFRQPKFTKWDVCFILLSYRKVTELNDEAFVLADYSYLYSILEKISCKDAIFQEYRILLLSLLYHNLDKTWLVEHSKKIALRDSNVRLDTLELINSYLS